MPSYAPPYDHPDALPHHPREYRRLSASERQRVRQEAAREQEEPQEAVRVKRKAKPWLLWLFSSVLIISGLSYYAIERNGGTPPDMPEVETTAALVTPPPAWDQVVAPAVLFAFDMPELQLPDMSVEARNYRQGGREDALSIGSVTDPFYLRIVVDRSQQQRSESFYIDLVRSAAQAGLSVKRTALSSEFQTKFGALEVTEATLAKETEARCLAFRGKVLDGAVGLNGWLCGENRFVEKDMLACFIDRLAATPAMREQNLEIALRDLDKSHTEACTTAMERVSTAE